MAKRSLYGESENAYEHMKYFILWATRMTKEEQDAWDYIEKNHGKIMKKRKEQEVSNIRLEDHEENNILKLLNEKERAVADLVIAGETKQFICEKLSISYAYYAGLLQGIYKKTAPYIDYTNHKQKKNDFIDYFVRGNLEDEPDLGKRELAASPEPQDEQQEHAPEVEVIIPEPVPVDITITCNPEEVGKVIPGVAASQEEPTTQNICAVDDAFMRVLEKYKTKYAEMCQEIGRKYIEDIHSILDSEEVAAKHFSHKIAVLSEIWEEVRNG